MSCSASSGSPRSMRSRGQRRPPRRGGPARARGPGAGMPRRPPPPAGRPRSAAGARRCTNSATWASGTAPMKPSTTLPSRMAKTAGIDCTWKVAETWGFSSTFTLASSTAPSVAATTRSRMGPRVLHGPHQGAQRSTTTGTVAERTRTSCSKVASVTSDMARDPIPVLRRRPVPATRRTQVASRCDGHDRHHGRATWAEAAIHRRPRDRRRRGSATGWPTTWPGRSPRSPSRWSPAGGPT